MFLKFPGSKDGFTALEMMIVLVILAVIMAIAAPSYRGYTAKKRLEGAAWQVYNDLMSARMAAVKKGVPVSLSVISGNEYSLTAGNSVSNKNIHPTYQDVALSTGYNPVFNSNGTVSSTGSIVVTSKSSLLSQKTLTISISRAGGMQIN